MHLHRFSTQQSYYFRKRIPTDLIPSLKQEFISLSLRDGLHSSAQKKASFLNITCERIFDALRAGKKTSVQEIRAELYKELNQKAGQPSIELKARPQGNLKELVEKFISDQKLTERRAKTTSTYKSTLSLMMKIFGNAVIAEVSRKDVAVHHFVIYPH